MVDTINHYFLQFTSKSALKFIERSPKWCSTKHSIRSIHKDKSLREKKKKIRFSHKLNFSFWKKRLVVFFEFFVIDIPNASDAAATATITRLWFLRRRRRKRNLLLPILCVILLLLICLLRRKLDKILALGRRHGDRRFRSGRVSYRSFEREMSR